MDQRGAKKIEKCPPDGTGTKICTFPDFSTLGAPSMSHPMPVLHSRTQRKRNDFSSDESSSAVLMRQQMDNLVLENYGPGSGWAVPEFRTRELTGLCAQPGEFCEKTWFVCVGTQTIGLKNPAQIS